METIQRWIHYKTQINELEAKNAKLIAALRGLLERHGDGSDEGPWAEWDTAREALREIGEL